MSRRISAPWSLLLLFLSGSTHLTGSRATAAIADLHCNDSTGVSLQSGQSVTVRGVVTANQPSGSNSRFYVQEGASGINVFGSPLYCGSPGDSVQVTGTITTFNGLTEIVLTAPTTVLATGRPEPSPLELTPNQVTGSYVAGTNCEPHEARLVQITSVYVRTSTGGWPTGTYAANTNYRLISAGPDSATNYCIMRVTNSANNCSIANSIVGAAINPWSKTQVTGVLVQFDTTSPYKSDYQVNVRKATDVTSGDGLPIQIDGNFTDWPTTGALALDPPGDAGTSGIDFRSVALANDAERLFLRFTTTVEVQPDEAQMMRFALDTDANAATGSPVGGLGAELVWDLGARTGTLYLGGTTESIGDQAIGLLIAPTVSGTEFEVAVDLGTRNSGNVPLFTTSPVRVAVLDLASSGDQAGSLMLYRLANPPLPPPPLSLFRRHPGHLRVAVYNTEQDGLLAGGARAAAFDRMIRAVGADVWIFNETFNTTGTQIETRLETLFPGTNWTAVQQQGKAVATRFPIREFVFFDVAVRDHVATRIDVRPYFDTDILVVGNYWKCCSFPGDDADRQDQADGLIGSLRQVRAGALMSLPANAPIIVGGDLNLVGVRQQLQTLLTGDIVNNGTWGPDSPPDWDSSTFDVVMARHPDERVVYTWRDDGSSFYRGKLDWIVYTGTVLTLTNSFVLDTRTMTSDSLAAHSLLATDTGTASDHAPIVSDFIVRNQVAIREEERPVRRLLGAGIPNPFSSSTTIRFDLPARADVDLTVFDMSGRVVKRLIRGSRSAGEHLVTWDGLDEAGRRAPAGVYLCHLRSGNVEETLRLVLLR